MNNVVIVSDVQQSDSAIHVRLSIYPQTPRLPHNMEQFPMLYSGSLLVICFKEWPWSKNLQAIDSGEGVERREPSYTDGIVNWSSRNGGQYGGSWKKKKKLQNLLCF